MKRVFFIVTPGAREILAPSEMLARRRPPADRRTPSENDKRAAPRGLIPRPSVSKTRTLDH